MTIARRPGEPPLGNPDVSGKVLSSTTAGVRSWVGIIDADHRAAVTGIHGIVAKGANLRSVGLGIGAAASVTENTVVAVGYNALNAAAGGDCTAVGSSALAVATSILNCAFGASALGATTTGAHNSAFGTYALRGNISGRYLTGVGSSAGRYLADRTTANATAVGGVYVGFNTAASVAGATNEVVIGYNAIGGGSNTVRLGNSNVANWLPGATNVCALGNSTTAFKELYLSDGTDEWKVTINTSGVLTTTKV